MGQGNLTSYEREILRRIGLIGGRFGGNSKWKMGDPVEIIVITQVYQLKYINCKQIINLRPSRRFFFLVLPRKI